MANAHHRCPKCDSEDVRLRHKRNDWFCDACDHRWSVGEVAESPESAGRKPKGKLFLSYGRRDAKELADRLCNDLTAEGYDVWRDTSRIRAGSDWQRAVVDGLRSTQIVVALLSPHAVRVSTERLGPDEVDSVCLDEISFARFATPPTPIVPVMAVRCEPPFCIFRLDYVDLCAWQDSEDQYRNGLARLREAIATALRGEVRFRSWEEELKPWDFAPFLAEKRRHFCGREWLFRAVDVWRCSRDERALLITGDPGTGKSAIVAQLAHLNPGGQVLAYHCCQADTPATLQPWRFVRSMAAMIASKLDRYGAQLDDAEVKELLSEAACRDDPASSFERGILTPLESLHAPEEGVRFILIDALDEALLHQGPVNIVDMLAPKMERLPGWLRIVATTRKAPDVLQRLRGLRAQELDAQDPRNLVDLDDYLQLRLVNPHFTQALDAAQATAEQVATTLRVCSEGNFLYARQALDGLERGTVRVEELDALPPGLDGLYRDFFRRHFPNPSSYETARRILEVTVAGQEPLPEDLLAAATELDAEEELPRSLRPLSAFMPKHAAVDGPARYAVFHRSLVDWLGGPEQRGTEFYANPARGHERLANVCWNEYQGSVEAMSAYAQSHLPSHLIAVRRWDHLETLLTDLRNLEARTEAGQIFDLVADFTGAVSSLPEDRPKSHILRLLEEALVRNAHFLAKHPTTLFQCLWNTCWWYDCTEAAEHYVKAPDASSRANIPREHAGPRLCSLLESWRSVKNRQAERVVWLRSMRPPAVRLGGDQIACLHGHQGGVSAVAVSPDNRRVVSGAGDKTIRVWDTARGHQVLCLEGHEANVSSVAVSPDSRSVASAAADRTVRLWDMLSGRELECLRHANVDFVSVAWSPDGRWIASGTGEGTVRLWDVEGEEKPRILRGHAGTVWS
ncbi:MAG: TIR domain-containing protein, partial [Planctomycetes bacterium]|nr:TIR domain-containing protein [Planctomycetota bacterium]